MSIRPVDFGGMIQRTDDVGMIKHQQDQKAVVDQNNIMVTFSKEEETKLKQVQDPEARGKLKNNTEDKNGGSDGYQGSQGERKKKKENQSKVIQKSASKGFDIKI